MSRKIVINPLTRISGFAEIDVTLDERNVVVEARTKGEFFRGFEQMMLSRSPFDAIFLTARICGICSVAHTVASATALEEALAVTVSDQGRNLRNLLHGCEFLQNHLRHFYQYTLPDYVRLPPASTVLQAGHDDFRLPPALNDQLAEHYLQSLQMSRLAHQMLAVIGGKVPHNHGVFVGGVTTAPTADQLVAMKSMLAQLERFIREKAVPDMEMIARYYADYFAMGRGPGNLLSYGSLYVEPLVYVDGSVQPFDPRPITEEISRSYYKGKDRYQPFETMVEPTGRKEEAYTWVKAPRYGGRVMEVGPLARMWLSGEYRRGLSAMDRTIARTLEMQKIAGVLAVLLDQIRPGEQVQQEWQLPQQSAGMGLVDTTRGALGHWLKIDNQVLSFYQIITPSAWNFSATDGAGVPGAAEQALLGTTIRDPEHPVELGRILRSFDPCISCATHVYRPGRAPVTVEIVGV